MALWLLGPDPAGNCCDCTGRTGPCDTCGEPAACSCALEIPPFLSPYADYATAVTAITEQVESCLAYFRADSLGVKSASFNGTTLSLSATDNGGVGLNSFVSAYVCVSLLAGESISIAFSVSSSGVYGTIEADLLDCSSGSTIDSDSAPGGTGTITGTLTVTATLDGIYYLHVQVISAPAVTNALTLSYNATGTSVFTVNPVIAQWDDSGTTRQLEACPKLLLPILTEATGSWYANLAAAQTAINNFTSNCVGYTTASSSFYTSFIATDGGTFLTVAFVVPAASSAQPFMGGWGSINALAGATLTFSFTISTSVGTASSIIQVYDQDGIQLANLSGTTSPLTYVTTYNGRYTVFLGASSNNPELNASITVTSSSAMSVNPIQALYATTPLLDCPKRLDC